MKQIFAKIIPTDIQKVEPLERSKNKIVRAFPPKIKE